MEDERDESIWKARLRWRMRGNWQGPAFVGSTLAGAVLLNRLPVSGDDGLDLVGGILLCGFANLALVGGVSPLLSRVLQRRRPSPVPLVVLQDRMGTSLMGALGVLFLVLGIAHHSSVTAAQDEFERQLIAVRAYVAHQPDAAPFRAGIGAESVWKQKDGFYRTCVPGPDPRRSLCLFVETEGQAVVRRDPDMQSNSRIAGSENPGRRGG